MKLIKFRITKYKSIKDSGYCWLASDLTILAGKNESGKTAILEALRDFDTDVEKIPDDALPLDESGQPVIELCFEINKPTLDEIAKEIKITIDKPTYNLIDSKGLMILKNHNGSYDLEKGVAEALDKQKNETDQQHIQKIQTIVKKLREIEQLSNIVEPKFEGGVETIQQAATQFVTQATDQIASIPEEVKKEKSSEMLAIITTEANALQKGRPSSKFLEEVVLYIPNFIFFSDFLDILPFELPLSEAKEHKVVKDFAKVAGLDLDKVIQAGTNTQLRRNILSRHSATISGDFMDYWGQDKLDLIAEPDGDKLRLGVKESGKTMLFKPEQRSKGFQWFLSFYLRLNAEKDETNIILIDEPGLYLHAKAQKDVLKVLKKISKEGQVIFSTHSPYLIDARRLDRIRLILKEDNGTRIENKIHKGADNETLTPIITAIGLDLTQQFSITGKRNVLLEGISDYYFLRALKEYLPESEADQVNLIPCVGASKIPQIASLLIGWDLEFLTVLDNDREGKRIARELSEKLSIDESKIIFVSNRDDFSIEDLFSHDDFNTFVLEDIKNSRQDLLNSKFLKEKKLDKVLLAKKFFEQIERDKSQTSLSQDTIGVFKVLFDKI